MVLALLSLLCFGLAWTAARQALAGAEEGLEEVGAMDRPLAGGPLSEWNADWQLDRYRALESPGSGTARQALDRAIALRPRSPDAWSERAVQRLDTGDLGGLEDADRALELGPNQSHTFVRLWPRWLFHWSRIGSDRQQRVLDLAERMSRRFPDWVVEVAEQYGRLAAVCGRIDLRARALDACRRAGWSEPEPQ